MLNCLFFIIFQNRLFDLATMIRAFKYSQGGGIPQKTVDVLGI